MLIVLVHLVLSASLAQAPQEKPDLTRLFHAIRIVETGGEQEPEHAVGDGGRSIGPYQISRAYLKDSGISGDWMRCRDERFSERVMLAYWQRHCPQALRKGDYETLARIHNGGPDGYRKTSTVKYWNLVRQAMASAPDRRPVVAAPPSGTHRTSAPVLLVGQPLFSTPKQPPKHVGDFRPLTLNQNPNAENAPGGKNKSRRG